MADKVTGKITIPIMRGSDGYTPVRGVDYWTEEDQEAIVAKLNGHSTVTSLDDTKFAVGNIIESVGKPVYVKDEMIDDYSAFGITESGWYVFARITPKDGVTVTESTMVEGTNGYILSIENNYVDVAVQFEVAAMSQLVVVAWDADNAETFVFKSTDLAVDGLDYRVTFYVYDIEEFAKWEYKLATDTTFAANKYYYTEEDGVYSLAEVTVGDAVPADTYYVHSKVTFEGMTPNITYRCNTPIDCPVVFILPEIEDETHGCWFEIRFRHMGTYSSTLQVPEGVKVATEHTQPETAGINMVDLHYNAVGGAKVWRFMNTHSSIPA